MTFKGNLYKGEIYEYGEQTCVVNVDTYDNCTLGIYHVTGQNADWATGFVVTPPGEPSLVEGSGQRLPDDNYKLSPTIGTSFKWVQPTTGVRAAKVHPIGKGTSWADVEKWTTACYVISTSYQVSNNRVFFLPSESQAASKGFNEYLGGIHHQSLGTKNYPGATFPNGMNKMQIRQFSSSHMP